LLLPLSAQGEGRNANADAELHFLLLVHDPEEESGPMIPQGNKRIKRRVMPELEADYNEYRRIVEDMVQNGGSLVSDPNWLIAADYSNPPDTYDKTKALQFALSEEGYRERFSKMKSLMKAWIGGIENPSEAVLSMYRRFLEHTDQLGLWHANVDKCGDNVPLLSADLGSIMDLNLLYAFASCSERRMTRLLEVGGGYGRLAEAAFNIFGRSLKFVLVDAVPASLYYSRKYLSYVCPDARVRSFYDGGGGQFNLEDVDIAIIPSWHFWKFNGIFYDICVNIESMQEMRQEHVDHYLSLFQSVGADGAIIYLSNAHDYYFRGSFNYPKNWQRLFLSNTPRSWTADHPTEIFRKTKDDHGAQNTVVSSAYNYGLWLKQDPEKFVDEVGYKKLIVPLFRGLARKLRSKLTIG